MPRKIRVTTTSLLVPGGPTMQDNREKARALLERARAPRGPTLSAFRKPLHPTTFLIVM